MSNHSKESKQAMDQNKYIKNQIHNIYDGYTNCPLGIEFTNPNSLNAIYEYIRQGRAYSIKEALNLYLGEMNR